MTQFFSNVDYPSIFEGKTIFACIDTSEGLYLMICDNREIEAHTIANPSDDTFAMVNAIGRELTREESGLLPPIEGCLRY
jgi:hypothetical protein